MKLITSLIIACLFATSSFAGGVSVSSQSPTGAEAAPMASAGTQWIIPLLALGMIALAISGQEDNPCEKAPAQNGEAIPAKPVC